MIADDLSNNVQFAGNHSFPKNAIVDKIIISIKQTHQCFIETLNTLNTSQLNEDELTQIFVKQNSVQLQYMELTSIYVGVQYREIYQKNTKGIPDIYYSLLEQGIENIPSFIMEAKRLPAPGSNREKEYVFGKTKNGNPNGGIERFKLEKHGLGLKECGILGYIEKEDFNYWFTQVNNWITELSNDSKNDWNINETLNFIESNTSSNYYLSNVNRNSDLLKLHHFWINIKSYSKAEI
ncbi:hypothetical protein [Apibacter sp. wkB309]|uniref:hypothetical protein n=1 Tax=Apibacter sp. wkB309 TaxID=1679467 RepID=UPI0011B01525|nr:hypothetical protein [Apibacter sp. wkB309]